MTESDTRSPQADVATAAAEAPRTVPLEPPMRQALDQHGRSVWDLSHEAPLLIVFLRHLGCTFCREALADIRDQRRTIEATGHRIVLVHMVERDIAHNSLERYGLGDAHQISDPDASLYSAFELRRGTLGQLFGWRSWARGFAAGVLRGHGVGPLRGDGLQMPGAFVVHQGRIVRAFRHRHASDRPDYCALADADRPPPAA